jgi:hypothetical protein
LDFVRFGTYSSIPSVDPREALKLTLIENIRRLPLSFVEIQQIIQPETRTT